ncbi:MAG: hypothetical protein R3C45_08230 [Phycisphaerales bacterium]
MTGEPLFKATATLRHTRNRSTSSVIPSTKIANTLDIDLTLDEPA